MEEAEEENMDKTAVQAAAWAEEEEYHKSSHISHRNRNPANSNRHKQRLKSDQQEAVSNVMATTTSVSVLI